MISIGLGNKHFQDHGLKPKGFRVDVGSLLLCTLAINVLSLALPVMTLQVYDRILPNPGTGTLPVLIAGVCLAIILEGILRVSRAYVLGRSGAAYEHRMACRAMKHVLNADIAYFHEHGTGEHLNRMGCVSQLKDFYNGYALVTLAELAFVPLFLSLVIYISGLLAFIPSLVLVSFILVSLAKGYRLRLALKARERADEKRFNFLIESLEGIHTLKSFGLEKLFERRYEALEEASCRENYNVTRETSSTFNAGAVFSHFMVAAVISFGALLVLKGSLTTGGLIATLLLSGRMMQPIQKALALWARYQDFTIAREKVECLFTTPQNTVVPFNAHGIARTLPAVQGAVKLDNVSFGYGDHRAAHLLKDVNLDVESGDIVLLSGAHGSGKTTLLKLIAGIYRAKDGEVIIDGANINTFPGDELPRHVGYISENMTIFRGTIRDNMTCFGQTSQESVKEIAALMGVDKEIAKLPGGFDTFLSGSVNDSLPVGLQQRIAMVRVLATKPRIILFDDADRALDRDGYAMLYSLMARLKGKVSIVMVSADKNVRALANRSYFLMDGHLTEIHEGSDNTNIRPYKELKL